MRYKEAVRFLGSFIDYEKIGYREKVIFSLERVKRLAEIFRNPQNAFRAVHIAGTKGKGSTAIFTAAILREAGYRTALYTSPHIDDPRERISLDGRMIEKRDFSEGVYEIKKTLNRERIGFKPTYFEILTILAFNYFKRKKAEYGVIEAGLGGRLDATNIINPKASVITPVSYDHTHILGGTLREIASEKAGIIKKGCIVVSSPQEKEVLSLIENRAQANGAKLILAGRDLNFKELRCDSRKEVFELSGRLEEYGACEISMIGKYQIENACAAVAACEALTEMGAKIKPHHIKRALLKALTPCRCEIIKRNPLVILDGAQNRASARAIAGTAKRNLRFTKMILVIGVCNDKDIRGICEELAPPADFIITTRADHERAANPERIKSFIKAKPVLVTHSVKDAMQEALSRAGESDLILIAGSFYVASEAKNRLGNLVFDPVSRGL